MNKSEVLFVGIGQAGNNIASEMLKKDRRYNGLFINTSYDDIKGLDNATNVFVIPAASGSARNRNRAKLYAKKHIHSMIDKTGEFPNQRVVNFVFSMGGGTGSGIAPALIQILCQTNPGLHINVIAIEPSLNESKKAHENCLACWNELMKIKEIRTFYILDNNKRANKLAINKEFADLYDGFMNTKEVNKSGIIDNAELELLTESRGFGAIYKIADFDNKKSMSKIIEDSIFSTGGALACKYLGLSVKEDFDYDKVIDIFKVTEDYFVGYTDDNPLLIMGGITLNSNVVKDIKENLESMKKSFEEEVAVASEDLIIDVDIIEEEPIVKETKEAVSIDKLMDNEDDFWNKIMNM
ncbi:hypothetical protein [Clostridium perfringens]|jgi:hypothetical protein|uniref:hypothetical protein n=1 Tax=Clostridium perfringens TaxID=1502 RepID=UPI0039ED891A